jgi:hypothetical protein
MRLRTSFSALLAVAFLSVLLADCSGSGGNASAAPPTPTPSPTPTPALGNLYVANQDDGTNTVLKFTLPLSSGSSPVAQVPVPAGSFGNVNGVAVNAQFIATLTSSGHVALFAQPLSSTSTPTVQFTLPQNQGALVAFDGSGDLWTATGSDTFDEYKPPFTNGMSPALNTDNIDESTGIVFDASGNLYITDGDRGELFVFAPPSYTGTPISVNLPGASGFSGSSAIGDAIIGTQIFVADSVHNLIVVFNLPITASSTAAVSFTAATGPAQPVGVASDSSGNLYVANYIFSNSKIFVFAPPFTAASTPAVTVTNGLSDPYGIAVGP